MLKPKTFVVAVAANLIAGVFAHPAAIPTTTLDLYATTPNPDLIPPNPTLIPPTPVGTHSVVFDTSEGFVPATASLPVIRRDESETSAGNSTLLSSDSSSSSSAVALEQRKVRHYLKVNCKQICDPWGEFYNQRVCEHPGCKTQEHDKVSLAALVTMMEFSANCFLVEREVERRAEALLHDRLLPRGGPHQPQEGRE